MISFSPSLTSVNSSICCRDKRADQKTSSVSPTGRRVQLDGQRTHLGRLLLQPVGVPLVLAVHLHLLRPQRHAAVAVEVQAVVSADVGPLLLPIAVLRLQELREAGLGPLWSGWQEEVDGENINGKKKELLQYVLAPPPARHQPIRRLI